MDKSKFDECSKKAAEGDPVALFDMGLSYITGNFVDKNTETGLEYIRQSADKGCNKAQRYLELWDTKKDFLFIRCSEESADDVVIYLLNYSKFKNNPVWKSGGKFKIDLPFQIWYTKSAFKGTFTITSNSGISTAVDKRCPYKIELKNFSLDNDKFDFAVTKVS